MLCRCVQVAQAYGSAHLYNKVRLRTSLDRRRNHHTLPEGLSAGMGTRPRHWLRCSGFVSVEETVQVND